MKYLGIDIGSSYLKTVLIDAGKRAVIRQSAAPVPPRLENADPRVYELDAVQIAETVREILEAYAGDYPGEVAGLFLSVQMHGFVYLAPGRADRYVSWQDTRCLQEKWGTGRSYLDCLKMRISRRDMENHGVYLKPSMGLCNLYAMLEAEPSLPKDGTLCTLGSYIILALTGRNVAHGESLAPLGILDVKNRRLGREVLELAGLDRIKLPELAEDDFEVCGVYRSGDSAIEVFPDYGDMQTAVLGSGLRRGEVVINAATAGQVARLSAEFVPGDYEIRPFFGGQYLYTLSDMPAGRNLAVLIRFIREMAEEVTGETVSEAQVWQQVHKAAANETGSLEADVNFYKNSHFPGSGSVRGITSENLNLGTLFAAACRNMAETYWEYIKRLVVSPEEIAGIVCAGGVSWRMPELLSWIRRVSGRECRLSDMQDEAAAGFLRLALALCERKKG